MSNVPQEIVDAMQEHGIREGAVISCVGDQKQGTVRPVNEWHINRLGEVWVGRDSCGNQLWGKSAKDYATVITPAPQQEQGLEEKDAVECGPAMRAAIVELAKELGLCNGVRMLPSDTLQFLDGKVDSQLPRRDCRVPRNWITPESFIAKMRVTAKKPKPEPPIMINVDDTDRKVIFKSGHITVGCTNVDNATVRAIASKLID